jgi:hypothetical protein
MPLKRSSRARLTPHTASEFPGETLHDRLGRVISEAACLPRKEFFESWAVAKRVRRRFQGRPVVELAAGHGLVSWILLLLDPGCPRAVCVDRRRPESAGRLEAAILARWPQLGQRWRYVEGPLDEVHVEPGALVVAVHACGRLTDRALTCAIDARAAVAVLPCCQSRRTSDTLRLEGWLEERLAVDVARAVRLQAAGYRIHTQRIPRDISPADRLLLGEPPAPGDERGPRPGIAGVSEPRAV